MVTTLNYQLRQTLSSLGNIIKYVFPQEELYLYTKSSKSRAHSCNPSSGSAACSPPPRDPHTSSKLAPGAGQPRRRPGGGSARRPGTPAGCCPLPARCAGARGRARRGPAAPRGPGPAGRLRAGPAATATRERPRQVPQAARRGAAPARPRSAPPGPALTQNVRLKMNSRILMQRIPPRTVPMAGAGSGSSSPGGSARLAGGSARGGERGGAGRQVQGWARRGAGRGRGRGQGGAARAAPPTWTLLGRRRGGGRGAALRRGRRPGSGAGRALCPERCPGPRGRPPTRRRPALRGRDRCPLPARRRFPAAARRGAGRSGARQPPSGGVWPS